MNDIRDQFETGLAFVIAALIVFLVIFNVGGFLMGIISPTKTSTYTAFCDSPDTNMSYFVYGDDLGCWLVKPRKK